MLNITQLAFVGLTVPMLLMYVLWLISGRGRNAAWVDLGWSLSIGLCALIFACLADGDPVRRLVLGALPALWATRLSWHLLTDRVIGPHKDGRYEKLKASWGINYKARFFLFFQVQAVLAFLLSVPFLLGATHDSRLSFIALTLGLLIFLIAFIGETVADRQLAAFKANPQNRGKVCQTGLWRYSRHPNYFFEWLHWVSYIFILMDTPWWWTALIVAGLMLYLVLFVTGIPPTEEQSLRSRGAAYEKYQKTTSAFFPWFPAGSGRVA